MSDLHIIPVRPEGFSDFEPTRYYVDVRSADPLVDKGIHRIEIHADVARHIHEQSVRMKRLKKENQALREALQRIADTNESAVRGGVAHSFWLIANEALKEQG